MEIAHRPQTVDSILAPLGNGALLSRGDWHVLGMIVSVLVMRASREGGAAS
jgi:hypothetical protein